MIKYVGRAYHGGTLMASFAFVARLLVERMEDKELIISLSDSFLSMGFNPVESL